MDDLLPEDIIFEILSRIPLKPLFRFRSVSKLWCKLIDHPSLHYLLQQKKRHQVQPEPILISLVKSTLTKQVSLHLVQKHLLSYKIPTLSLTQFPVISFGFNNNIHNYSFGSCNGFVYFADKKNPSNSISLCNPLREKQCLELPHPTNINIPLAARKTYGLGFDSSTNTFKMVCVFFTQNTPFPFLTIVLTLGTSTWRQISQVPPCPISGTPVFSHGYLHWKIDPCFVDYDNMESSTIVSFDVKEETFKFFTHHPKSQYSITDFGSFQLLDQDGNLAIAEHDSTTGDIRVWVMKDYGQKLWVLECLVPIKYLVQVEVLYLGKDGELLLSTFWGMFFTYNSEIGLMFTHARNFEPYPMIHGFNGSLFSVKNFVTPSS